VTDGDLHAGVVYGSAAGLNISWFAWSRVYWGLFPVQTYGTPAALEASSPYVSTARVRAVLSN
jgi:hypothetical protein